MSTHEQKEELIIKFLQHEASEHEIEILKTWLEEDTSHKKYFDEVNDTFQASITTARFNHERIDNAWNNVHRKINLHDKIEKRISDEQSLYAFLKIAAAISALVILSYVAWHYYHPSTTKLEHAIVYNSERSNTRVDLPDGSVVLLNKNSTLEYPLSFGATSREVFLAGEAFFDIKKDDKSFIVKAKEVSIHVKGTRFNVRAYSDEEDVKTTLEEGKVELQVKGTPNVYPMAPGEQITVHANLNKITLKKVDPSDFSSWKEEKLAFDDTPLSDIILKLENRYKVNITIDSAIAERERLTMTIEQETIEEVLEFIRLSSHLKYRKDKTQIFIYE